MLTEHIVNSLLNEGTIKDEEIEIIQFGLESLEGNLLGIILTLIIGFCFNRFRDALLLWMLQFPLRKNAGGFHASTKMRCFLISLLMLFVSFTFFTTFNCTFVLYGLSVLTTGWIIWILVPMGNPLKELDETEHEIYQIRSRSILTLEGIIFLLAFYFKCSILVRSIAMTFFLVSISLLMGAVKLLICNKNHDCK